MMEQNPFPEERKKRDSFTALSSEAVRSGKSSQEKQHCEPPRSEPEGTGNDFSNLLVNQKNY